MRWHSLLLVVLLAGVPVASAMDERAEPTIPVRSIDDVIRNASRRDKVVIGGTVKRVIDFDTIMLSDDHAEIAVSFVGVRQGLKNGDKILVAGRFDGRVGYKSTYGLVNALEWLPMDDSKAEALKKRYPAPPAVVAPVPAPAAAPELKESFEKRLQELEQLKEKKLISPEEYQEQRKRILDQL